MFYTIVFPLFCHLAYVSRLIAYNLMFRMYLDILIQSFDTHSIDSDFMGTLQMDIFNSQAMFELSNLTYKLNLTLRNVKKINAI